MIKDTYQDSSVLDMLNDSIKKANTIKSADASKLEALKTKYEN
jgi:hypothetical protein